ncbi:hypothetical protein FOMPIDRAFT_116471 [Fomitopsis schrenkii]|uniref:Uncharacterized protein n=1 Tax=Fomitopsis schrenkii TaxID=2126942 RepID=S8DJC6_FOMSC|nr:hypothetical protein FOMPIDRAFT_116471 [Fomitopsis schrenkii]
MAISQLLRGIVEAFQKGAGTSVSYAFPQLNCPSSSSSSPFPITNPPYYSPRGMVHELGITVSGQRMMLPAASAGHVHAWACARLDKDAESKIRRRGRMCAPLPGAYWLADWTVEGQCNDGAPHVGVDLSSDRVVLTSKVLDPWAVPQDDACYLEVIASVSRTTIHGKPSFFVAPTATVEEFRVVPFDDIASDDSDAARKALEEEAPIVALPAQHTQGKHGADGASVDATSEPEHLNTGAILEDATSTASNKGSDEPDFFYDELCPSATMGFIAIRFFVRKEVDGVTKAFLATPPIALLPVRSSSA